MEYIQANVLANALDYRAYRHLVTALLSEGKLTGPGVPLNEEMLEYTRLNEQRMNRIEKTFRPHEEAFAGLAQIAEPITWLVITEGWCGDAAQIIPTLQKMAESNPNILLRFILRDQHLDIMDAFLTNGGRSIPKILFVAPANGKVLGHWGPRPVAAHEEMTAWANRIKATEDSKERKQLYEEAKTAVHTWYAHDKTISTQREVASAVLSSLQIDADVV
jgi:hypothetical protein